MNALVCLLDAIASERMRACGGRACHQEEATQALGPQLHILEVRSPAEFLPAFQDAMAAGAEAMHMSITAMLNAHLAQIVDLAARSRLPAMAQSKDWAEAGLLMSYGPNRPICSGVLSVTWIRF
jgi:hypothetical protein